MPPSAQLVVPTATNVQLSPAVEVSYQAERVVEQTLHTVDNPDLNGKTAPLPVPHYQRLHPSPSYQYPWHMTHAQGKRAAITTERIRLCPEPHILTNACSIQAHLLVD